LAEIYVEPHRESPCKLRTMSSSSQHYAEIIINSHRMSNGVKIPLTTILDAAPHSKKMMKCGLANSLNSTELQTGSLVLGSDAQEITMWRSQLGGCEKFSFYDSKTNETATVLHIIV
jgi:hypothetical protein